MISHTKNYDITYKNYDIIYDIIYDGNFKYDKGKSPGKSPGKCIKYIKL
jgi:hypothetical protein